MKTKIYAHRGSSGKYPENTMLAFEKAIEEGAEGIEIDVHLSKDGEVVIIHDETLNKTTEGTGLVKEHTLAELKKLRVPSLVELLELMKGTDLELNIEHKTYLINYPQIEEKVLAIVKEHGAGRKVVHSSFHLPTVLRVKKLDPAADIAWLLSKFPIPHPADYIKTLGLEALHMDKDAVLERPEHFKGVYDKLRVWTVNNDEEKKTLIGLGVAAIITDYPIGM